MRAAGLEVNYTKFSFGLKVIPYLGYVITWVGIKPDPKKLQGIMDIWQHTTTTEAKSLIGMVHHYRYMWPRRYKILAPLTEVASSPKAKGRNYFGMMLWNIHSSRLSLWSKLRPHWIIQIRKLLSLYTQMLLINIWVLLLSIIMNLLHFSQGD